MTNQKNQWTNSRKRRGVSLYKNGKYPTCKYYMRFTADSNSIVIVEYFKTKEEAYDCFYETYTEWNGKTPWDK